MMMRVIGDAAKCLIALVVLSGTSPNLCLAASQDKPNRMHQDSIQTGASQDGIKYFIRIVPHDTSKIERMPTVPGQDFVEVNRQPTVIHRVSPKYPKNAMDNGIEGTVWLNCLIGGDGKVKETAVLRYDQKVFVQPSIDAVMKWEFVPAQLHGRPVKVWASIPFRFKLSKK